MMRADQVTYEHHYSDDERDAVFRRRPVHLRKVRVDDRRNHESNVGKTSEHGYEAKNGQSVANQDVVWRSPVGESDQDPESRDRRCNPKRSGNGQNLLRDYYEN